MNVKKHIEKIFQFYNNDVQLLKWKLKKIQQIEKIEKNYHKRVDAIQSHNKKRENFYKWMQFDHTTKKKKIFTIETNKFWKDFLIKM